MEVKIRNMYRIFIALITVFTLLVILIVPSPVMAQTGVGTTSVSAQTGYLYTLSPPGSVNFGSMTTEGKTITGLSLSASTNDTTIGHVTISVYDADSSNAGRMKHSAANEWLSTALVVGGTNINGATISNTPQQIVPSGICNSSTPYSVTNMSLTQPVFSSVSNVGTYSTTLTFSATFSP
jgi:hypothetical protein